MAFMTLNGVQYHYEISGSGPMLLLLHGFTGSGDNWEAHVPSFAKQFSVMTVDLLGHGQTDAAADSARYRMEQAGADLAQLIESACEPPVHLLGYSMGGRLALYVAITYPDHVKSLILESASPGLADTDTRSERVRLDEALAQRIEAEGVDAFVDYWETLPLFASQKQLPERQRQRLREQRLGNRASGLANSLRGMGTGTQPSFWDGLNELKIPALLLAGALDSKFVSIAREMVDLLPSAQLAIAADAGHTVHLEASEFFRSHILKFLAQH